MASHRRPWKGKTVSPWVLWPPALILAVLLFVGGPGYRSQRSLQAFWDLGHIGAFSLWTYLLVTWKQVEETSPAPHHLPGSRAP